MTERGGTRRAALLASAGTVVTLVAGVATVVAISRGSWLAALGAFVVLDVGLGVAIGSFIAAARGRDPARDLRVIAASTAPVALWSRDEPELTPAAVSEPASSDPATAERRAQLLAVTALAARRLAGLETEQIEQELVRSAVSLGVDHAAVFELDHGAALLRRTHEHGLRPGCFAASLAIDTAPLTGALQGTQEVLAGSPLDPSLGPGVADLLAVAATPIPVDDRVDAVLVVGLARTGQLSPEELEALELLALHAARSLSNARWFEAERRALAGMEALARREEDFVSTVSHELRTPLTVTRGAAELLASRWRELDDDGRDQLLERLVAGVADLEGTVDRVLDFHDLDTGRLPLRPAWVPLDEVIAEVLDRRPRTEAHRVAWSVRPAGLAVEADRTLLVRALTELVDNAVQHTPPETGIELRAGAVGGRARVEVRDHGPGLDPDELEQLTRRFQRGEEVLTRPTRGLGLGLTTVREIARAHGTDLQLWSEPGAGLTASLMLPARTPSASRPRLTASPVIRLG